MPSWLQRAWLCALTVLMFVSFAIAGDLAAGKRAYEQKDYATAFKELSPLAEKGDPEAQFILGKMYWRGEGVLKDLNQGTKYFKLSAEQGNAAAQFFMGSIYVLPHTDIAEGVKWLRLSAEQGNQDAQWLLGKIYLQGDKDLPRDPVQAEMWLLLAAKENLEFYQKALLAAEKQMTSEQIASGKALAAAWKPKPGLRPGQLPQRDSTSGAVGKPHS